MGIIMKLKHWIFIGIAAVIILAIVFRSDVSKKLRDLLKKDLQEKELVYKKKYDSIQKVRKNDSIQLIEALRLKDDEIDYIQSKFELQYQKNKAYEKELATYRNGDYHDRYSVFSKTYNPQGDN